MIIVLTTANKSATYWKQERLVLKATGGVIGQSGDGVRIWSDIEGSSASPIAQYTFGNGDLYIDLTEYARAYAPATIYWQPVDDEGVPGGTYTISLTIAGLIDPAGVIIPPHPLMSYDALVLPPSLMYIEDAQQPSEGAEFYATSGTWTVTGASMASNKRAIGQISGAFTISDGTHSHTFTPRTMDCGKLYALVEWVSFSGVIRTHWFEVVKSKTSVIDAYSLLNINNEYTEIKGREDGFTLQLLGLNTYDFWYYSDVLTSSKVQISLDGTNYTQVQVTSKSVTIPDGDNNDGKLEINVNWKRYDAVTM